MNDVDLTETLVHFGHNPAETGTVFFERIMKRKKETNKPYMIVVDVRETLTSKEADLFLQLNPGTNLALLNGLLHLVIRNGVLDHDFIREHTIRFDDVKKSVEPWTPELTSQVTGVPVEKLKMAADIVGSYAFTRLYDLARGLSKRRCHQHVHRPK
jgi:anaerobic selenocysteine-containing dehydrogenase